MLHTRRTLSLLHFYFFLLLLFLLFFFVFFCSPVRFFSDGLFDLLFLDGLLALVFFDGLFDRLDGLRPFLPFLPLLLFLPFFFPFFSFGVFDSRPSCKALIFAIISDINSLFCMRQSTPRIILCMQVAAESRYIRYSLASFNMIPIISGITSEAFSPGKSPQFSSSSSSSSYSHLKNWQSQPPIFHPHRLDHWHPCFRHLSGTFLHPISSSKLPLSLMASPAGEILCTSNALPFHGQVMGCQRMRTITIFYKF